MPDFPLVYSVPGGNVGLGALPAGEPFDIIGRTPSSFASANRVTMNAGAGGSMTNAVNAAAGRVGWRCFSALAGVGGCLSQVQYGAGGFNKFPSLASIISGAVTGFVASRFGHYYVQIDARLTITVGDANEMSFVFSPSFLPFIGNTFGFSQGVGLAWYNSAANDNFRLVVCDASGVVFTEVDTGISAISVDTKMLRIEWGWISSAARIRALIDNVVVATLSAPLGLNTLPRLAAFTNPCNVLTAKNQNGNNEIEAFVGMANGLEMGVVEP